MCGRYRLSRRKQIIEEHFDSVSGEEDWTPRYNIAPTQPVTIIRQHPKEPRRELSLVSWGLIPSWAKDASGAATMINARSETASTKPAFRDALKSRRCIVPADGFYEWARTGKTKQPYCFEVNDGELFAFAGLWERWKDPSGEWIKTYGKFDRYQIKKRYVRKDGEMRSARVTVSALRAPSGELQFAVAMVEDITSQELAQRTLLQMSNRLLQIQEEEQRRIAREVHDSTSQEMTALTLNLGALKAAQHTFPEKARTQISESLALAKRVAREIRTFSYLLHPPLLNELGLWAALRMFVEEFRDRSGLRVSLEISKAVEVAKLHPNQDMALFRFVQEALANVHRHSGSKTATVNVRLKDRSIEASVADTGRGFAPALLKEIQSSSAFAGGVGISGMHERIGYIGGQLKIRSDKHGTTVTAVVPLDYQPASTEPTLRPGSTSDTPSRAPIPTPQSE